MASGGRLIFGVGTDIIEVARVARQLAQSEGLREQLFTAREIAYCESKGISSQHYAARFAAKEAFLKAMGTGWRDGFHFREIEVLNDELGKPEISLHGEVEKFCTGNQISGVQVSLSHTKDFATAVVVLDRFPV
jgi:holo-[acyl-carrier protein] synthase